MHLPPWTLGSGLRQMCGWGRLAENRSRHSMGWRVCPAGGCARLLGPRQTCSRVLSERWGNCWRTEGGQAGGCGKDLKPRAQSTQEQKSPDMVRAVVPCTCYVLPADHSQEALPTPFMFPETHFTTLRTGYKYSDFIINKILFLKHTKCQVLHLINHPGKQDGRLRRTAQVKARRWRLAHLSGPPCK